MDKTIFALLLLGLVLAILHAPSFVLHLGIITGLLLLTIRLFWMLLRPLSAPRSNNLKPSNFKPKDRWA